MEAMDQLLATVCTLAIKLLIITLTDLLNYPFHVRPHKSNHFQLIQT